MSFTYLGRIEKLGRKLWLLLPSLRNWGEWSNVCWYHQPPLARGRRCVYLHSRANKIRVFDRERKHPLASCCWISIDVYLNSYSPAASVFINTILLAEAKGMNVLSNLENLDNWWNVKNDFIQIIFRENMVERKLCGETALLELRTFFWEVYFLERSAREQLHQNYTNWKYTDTVR